MCLIFVGKSHWRKNFNGKNFVIYGNILPSWIALWWPWGHPWGSQMGSKFWSSRFWWRPSFRSAGRHRWRLSSLQWWQSLTSLEDWVSLGGEYPSNYWLWFYNTNITYNTYNTNITIKLHLIISLLQKSIINSNFVGRCPRLSSFLVLWDGILHRIFFWMFSIINSSFVGRRPRLSSILVLWDGVLDYHQF